MNVAIVGNRIGWSKDYIFKVLDGYSITSNDIIISGGAFGVDTYAQEYAKKVGCEIVILYPKIKEPIPERYFNRNLEIAKRCDILIAFDKKSSKYSGTLNTINHAKKLNKQVIVYREEISCQN